MTATPTPLPGVMPAPAAPATPVLRRIRRLGVLSLAKFYGVMMAALGFIFGVVFLLFTTLMATALGAGAAETGIMAGAGVFVVILFPLMYGAMGFVFGALTAWLYNLIAGRIGGIEILVE